MGSENYHEPLDTLSKETRNMHRALVSLQEELEAIDWYQQRADACTDHQLQAILLHNMEEEIEHACMLIEWLRRNHSNFDEQLRTYLFTEQSIEQIEEHEGDSEQEASSAGRSNSSMKPAKRTVGSLKEA